jgi:hypothetical protein
MLDRNSHSGQSRRLTALTAVMVPAFVLLLNWLLPMSSRAFGIGTAAAAQQDSRQTLWPISIDYSENESVFPPGITPPTFLWRDAAGTSWNIDITFADKTAPIHLVSRGEHLQMGMIDPECVPNRDEPPKLTPQQAATWIWNPGRRHVVEDPSAHSRSGSHDHDWRLS